ncbi:MAG: hypothetical protein KBF32_07275 [Chitinophagales bacterium]|nr:hypothetical protein [Chitinophagales bacterium]
MKTIEHRLPVTIQQVLDWVNQCTDEEKKILLTEILRDSRDLMLASEQSLAKDWLSLKEDEAWKDL